MADRERGAAFRIGPVNRDAFLSAVDALPELYCGAGGFLRCTCAAITPTMPVYRSAHLPSCPIAALTTEPSR